MSPQITLSPLAWALLLLLALVWGGSFLSNAVLLREGAGVASIVTVRIAIAAAVCWAYVALRRLPVPRAPRIWAGFLIMGAINNVLPFFLITWGQQHIASGLASILNASTAIFGVLVAALLFADERLTARKGAGVALGFCGVALVIGPAALAGFSLSSLGQLALIGSSLSYAFAGAFGRRAFAGIAPEVAAAGVLSGATLLAIPWMVFADGLPSALLSPAALWPMLYLGCMATGLAYLLYYNVLALAGSGSWSRSWSRRWPSCWARWCWAKACPGGPMAVLPCWRWGC